MLLAVGDLVEDIVVRLPGPPRPDADTSCLVSRHRGGSGANTAAVAVRCGLPARFVGQVGDDPVGTRLVEELRAAGVDVAVRRAGRSGTIVVLVDPVGQRTMLTDRGTSPDLGDPDPAWLDGATVVHVPAYSLCDEPQAAATRTVLRWAGERGVPSTVDASSLTVIHGLGRRRFLALLDEIRPAVLFCNRDEGGALALESVPPQGVQLAVVKDGPRPARLLRRGEAPVAVAVPRAVCDAVDSTGAGDAFAGGFLAAWVAGEPPTAAVLAGHRAAARVITGPGGDHWRETDA